MDLFLLSSSCIHRDRGPCLLRCMWTSGAWSRDLPYVNRRKMADLLTIHMCNRSRSPPPLEVPCMTYAEQDWAECVYWDLFYPQRTPDHQSTKRCYQGSKLASHNRKLALRCKAGAPFVLPHSWDLLGLYLVCVWPISWHAGFSRCHYLRECTWI